MNGTTKGMVLAAAALLVIGGSPAGAVDQLVPGSRLALKASSGKEKLSFKSKGTFTLPIPGSANDPAQVGATLEILNPNTSESSTLSLPSSHWSGNAAGTLYKYRDSALVEAGKVKIALIRGRQLKVSGSRVGITLNEASQGSLAVVLTSGSFRYCALFGGAAVRRDQPGVFNAKGATPPPMCPAPGATTTTTIGAGTTTTLNVTTTTLNGTTTTLGATTTTSATSSSTTTTQPPGLARLRFTTAQGTTSCGAAGLATPPAAPFSGQLDSDTAGTAKISDLGSGCLYLGGGNATIIPPGPIPDNATSTFDVTGPSTLAASAGTGAKDCTKGAGPGHHCVNNNAQPACATDVDCGGTAGACALDANCFFGPPLPILSPSPFGALTTCVVDAVQADGSGTFNAGTGDASVGLLLASRVYITGNTSSPCPRCSSGACTYGQHAGAACTTNSASQTSLDCPPTLTGFQAPLPVNLTPLSTGLSFTQAASGLFCPSQANAGAFGKPATRAIQQQGSPAGNLNDNLPHPAVLGYNFCIPATGNAAVDGVADLPGPGSIGLAGNAQLVPPPTTTTSPATTTTTGSPGSTTTTTAGATTTTTNGSTTTTTGTVPPPTTTTLLPALGTVTFTISQGTTSCGGAGLSPPPAAPFSGEVDLAGGSKRVDLGLGCLYFGGGGAGAFPPAPIPDGGSSVLGVTGVSGLSLTVGANPGNGPADCTFGAGPTKHCLNGSTGINGMGSCNIDDDCPGNAVIGACDFDANCFFGPPTPIALGALSTCIVNGIAQNLSGNLNLLTRATTLNAGLTSRIYLTSNNASPCPQCLSGTCNAGKRAGLACSGGVGSRHTSIECPPSDNVWQGRLAVSLSPVTTGATVLSNAGGNFCAGQANPGAFGGPAGSIHESGAPLLGNLGSPFSTTLAGVFCVPATGSPLIDGLADLPGPGAVSVPGMAGVSLIGIPLP